MGAKFRKPDLELRNGQSSSPVPPSRPLTTYAPAIDAGAVSPATTFDNYPVRLLNGSPGPRTPPTPTPAGHPSGRASGTPSTPIAVQTLEKVGVTAAYNFATQNLGLDLAPEDMNVSPLGMGGLTYGLSTVDMAAAFSAFANNGVYNEPPDLCEGPGQRQHHRGAGKRECAAGGHEGDHRLPDDGHAGGCRLRHRRRRPGSAVCTSPARPATTNDNFDRYFAGYTPY